MKTVIVYHHLGLGDHIICNGLVREIFLRDDPDFLYLPVKAHNMASVSRMYLDECRITCLPVSGDAEVCTLKEFIIADKIYKVGFEKVRRDWDISFYDSVGIPFEKRWTMFKCYRDKEKELCLESVVNPTKEPFVLIHDNGSNISCNFHVRTNLKIIKVQPITDCMMDWGGIIEKASEIHCIDSSFIHLCQSLGVKGFFECGFKNDLPFVLLPSWKLGNL